MYFSLRNNNYILALVLFFFYAGNAINPLYLIAAICFIVFKMTMDDDEHNLYLTCFLIPFIRVFDLLGVTYVVNLLFVYPLVVGVLKGHLRIDKISFVCCVFFTLIELVHVIAFGDYSSLPSSMANIAMLLYVLCFLIDRIRIKLESITDYLCLGVITSAVVYLFCNPTYAFGIVSNVLRNERFIGFAGEPNYYALYICLALSLIFTLEDHKIKHYCYMSFMTIIGLLTASKMCLFLIGFIYVIGLLYNGFNSNNKRFKFFAITITLIYILGLIFNDNALRLLNNIIARMNVYNGRYDINEISTGRSRIVLSYLELCMEKPSLLLLGYGMRYHINLNQEYGAHNTYLDIIFSWGIFVTFVLLILWANVLNRLKLFNTKHRFICYFPALVLSVNLLDLSCFNAGMFWLVFTVSILPLIFENNERVKGDVSI